MATCAVLTSAVAAAALASPAQAASTPWAPPLHPMVVVRAFDQPAGPYAPGHRGVDLAGSDGQPVLAAADGVVSYAGQVGGIGVVALSHGSVRTTYQPVDASVAAGAWVVRGAQIGLLLAEHGHCAPEVCLHWGALVDGVYVDPLALLDPAPSRLLPYWGVGGGPGTLDRLGAATEPDDALAEPGQFITGQVTPGIVVAASAMGRFGDLRAEPAGEVTPETEPRAGLPTGAAVVVAALGTILAATAFVAVRRRRR